MSVLDDLKAVVAELKTVAADVAKFAVPVVEAVDPSLVQDVKDVVNVLNAVVDRVKPPTVGTSAMVQTSVSGPGTTAGTSAVVNEAGEVVG